MDAAFRAGTVLVGRYRVDSAPVRDGMCLVYRVTHVQLGEELLLKVLRPATATSLTVHARFVREAQSALRLRGEHVARLVDVGILPDGVPYAVTEAVRGVDLAGELARRGPVPPGQAVDLALQVCDALAEAQAYGILHRDLKPASLWLIGRADGTPMIKVVDFGICKTPVAATGALASGEAAIGTPGYMSPEQMKAIEDLDGRTDIWALGVVLYEMLTGQHPFKAATPAATARMAAMAPPEPFGPRVPGGLQAIVFRCLEKSRDARFPSAAALAVALRPFAQDQHAAALTIERAKLIAQGLAGAGDLAAAVPASYPVVLPPIAVAAAPSRSRRRYATIAVIALAVSVGGISAAALIAPGRSRAPAPTLESDLLAHDASPAVASPAAAAKVATAGPAAAGPVAAGPAAARPAAERVAAPPARPAAESPAERVAARPAAEPPAEPPAAPPAAERVAAEPPAQRIAATPAAERVAARPAAEPPARPAAERVA
ncbi:MAG TPA: serine/threonine-protein kinase, partial [Kofleriaceae bacterium]